MKRFLFFFLTFLSIQYVLGSTKIGDLYYELNPYYQTAGVTYEPSGSDNYKSFSSAIIPKTVSYDGVTYSVTSIEDYAFYNCTGLTSVEIPNSVTSIRNSAFYGCTSLTRVDINDMAAWCKINFEYVFSNPLCYAHHLFLNGIEIKELKVSNTITSIRSYVFYGCSGLTSVEIPNSVTSIGNSAFSGCSGLTSVEIPNSVTSIGNSAFSGCSGLTSVEIPNSVNCIEDYTFTGCSGLTSVLIPNSVTSIGNLSFSGCSDLKNLEIPNSVISIKEAAFEKCSSLASVVIPNSVTKIYSGAFEECYNLNSVEIDDLARWCNITFGDLTANPLFYAHNLYLNEDLITELKIPNSITSIKSYSFCGCSSLTSVEIPNSVTSIRTCAFYDCKGLTKVLIPNSVTSIGSFAFRYCSSLKNIIIPNSIITIYEKAFEGCTDLETLIFGYSIDKNNTIYSNAFKDCDIKKIYITTESAPKIYSDTFSDYSAEVYTLTSAKSSFQSATGWKNFTKFRALVEVQTLSVDKTEIQGFEGEEFQLNATISPDNATLKNVFWSSDDIYAATVDYNGKVRIVDSFGYCTIKCESIYPGVEPVYITVNGLGENPDAAVENVFEENNLSTEVVNNDIYTLQGVCLKRNASQENINALTPGLYIINGKKVMVK